MDQTDGGGRGLYRVMRGGGGHGGSAIARSSNT